MTNKSDNNEIGLSDNNVSLIVVLVFVLLLLFGPIEPYGLVVRTVCLFFIPLALWALLYFLGGMIPIDNKANEYINRGIYFLITGLLLLGAYFSFTADSHMVCDYVIQTRDGQECVGDYKSVDGSDIGSTFIQIVLAGIAFWMAISKREDGEDN